MVRHRLSTDDILPTCMASLGAESVLTWLVRWQATFCTKQKISSRWTRLRRFFRYFILPKALIAIWFYKILLLQRIADEFAMSKLCARLHQLREQFALFVSLKIKKFKNCFQKTSDTEEIHIMHNSSNRNKFFMKIWLVWYFINFLHCALFWLWIPNFYLCRKPCLYSRWGAKLFANQTIFICFASFPVCLEIIQVSAILQNLSGPLLLNFFSLI